MAKLTKICLLEDVDTDGYRLRSGMFGKAVFRINRRVWLVEFRVRDTFIVHKYHRVYAEVREDMLAYLQ